MSFWATALSYLWECFDLPSERNDQTEKPGEVPHDLITILDVINASAIYRSSLVGAFPGEKLTPEESGVFGASCTEPFRTCAG